MIHDVGTLLDVAVEEANIRRRYSTKINNTNQIQQLHWKYTSRSAEGTILLQRFPSVNYSLHSSFNTR